MAVIENLDIVLGARTEKLDGGLDRSTGRVRKFESDVGKIGKAAEATLSPLRDLGMSILAAVPGASAAASAFSAITAAFAGSAASKVAKETRETSQESSRAAVSMREFATAAVVAAAATGRIDVPDVPRLGGSRGGLALYNPATARAGARGGGMGDVIDAEFTQISAGAAGTSRAISMLGPVGIAIGATVAAGFVAAAVGVKALQVTIAGVREQMSAIDQTADAAKRLGFQFNELVTLRMAIGRSTGMDDGQIDSALSKMQLNLAEARSGSGALAQQLKSLGLDAGQLLKAGPVDAMKQISAAAQQMKSPIDQNKLAFDLAGKAGVALAQSLRDGPAAIEEAATKAKQLGLTLSQVQTEQVGAANDAWEDMQLVATGVFRQIAAEVSPVITAIATSVTEVAASFGGWQTALPAIVDGVVVLAGALYDGWEMANLLQSTLYKIVTLDWGSLGEGVQSALDFSTGEQWLAKVNAARQAAASAAAAPAPVGANADAIEAEREASKAAADAKKQQAADREREDARNKSAIADRLGGLRDEVAVLGQAASAADRLKLARQGATQSQLAEFDALMATKQRHEDLSSAMERGKEIAAQYRTPMEEFNTQLQDLNRLFDVGAIDFNTYAKATRDAAKKAGGESAAAKQLKDTPTIAALQRGSVEAYSAANKNDKSASAAALQEKANKLLEQVNLNLEAIARQRGQTLKQA